MSKLNPPTGGQIQNLNVKTIKDLPASQCQALAGGKFEMINMPKKPIINRLLVTFGWLLVITLLRWDWRWNLIGFWIGGALGTFLLEADHLFYTLLIYHLEPTSLKVKELFKSGRYQEMILLLANTTSERTRLTFHNALFQLFFFVVCFFALTSTGGLLGQGLVMAMALSLLRNEFVLLFQAKEEFLKQLLFWPVKIEVSSQNLKFFVVLMLLVFLGLNLLLI